MNLKVYLAGGMSSNWRKDVINFSCTWDLRFIDPTKHQLTDPEQYTGWDLLGVKTSDIVFAFMEYDNPSGYGLALEIGYAKAMGKHIILCDTKSPKVKNFKSMFAIVRNSADIVFNDLEEAIEYLYSFNRL